MSDKAVFDRDSLDIGFALHAAHLRFEKLERELRIATGIGGRDAKALSNGRRDRGMRQGELAQMAREDCEFSFEEEAFDVQ